MSHHHNKHHHGAAASSGGGNNRDDDNMKEIDYSKQVIGDGVKALTDDNYLEEYAKQQIAQGIKPPEPLSQSQEKELIAQLAMQIGGRVELETVIRRPNVKSVQDVVDQINATDPDNNPIGTAIFGTLIDANHIALCKKNGIYYACGPGRWSAWSPRAEWIDTNISLAGNQLRIQQGPVTILRVPAGHYALAWEGNKPLLLSSEDGGLYTYNDANFHVDRFVRMDEGHIAHGTIHILRVAEGTIALVRESGQPALLPAGRWAFNSNAFQVAQHNVGLDQECFKHGTITRFIVRAGQVGLAWQNSIATFLDKPGVYLIRDPLFSFESCVSVDEKEITLGSKKIITVQEGEVGISHDAGVLRVLPPGRFYISKAGHIFDEFLNTQQQCLTLDNTRDSPDQLMVCETRELVRIGVAATVFYNICDPRLAVIKIGSRRAIQRFINESATAVITTIIRSTSLAEISTSGQKPIKVDVQEEGAQDDQVEEEEEDEDLNTNLAFFDSLKNDFIKRLRHNFQQSYGIYMLNVRIGDFKVLEENIARSIASQAMTTADTMAKLANLEGRRQIDLVQKDAEARVKRIDAEVDAHQVACRTRAEAQAVKERAEAAATAMTIEANAVRDSASAKADAMTIDAEARAKSINIIAQAEAGATRERNAADFESRAKEIEQVGTATASSIKVRADAEAERAGKLGNAGGGLGRELVMSEIQANMVTESLKGVEKVVYLPHEMAASNPFALFGAMANGGGNNALTDSGRGGRGRGN